MWMTREVRIEVVLTILTKNYQHKVDEDGVTSLYTDGGNVS